MTEYTGTVHRSKAVDRPRFYRGEHRWHNGRRPRYAEERAVHLLSPEDVETTWRVLPRRAVA